MDKQKKQDVLDEWKSEFAHSDEIPDGQVQNAIYDWLSETLDKIHDEAVKQERERWLNQDTNAHDQEIRKDERERILEKVDDMKVTGLMSNIHGYNQALDDLRKELE